MYTRTKLLASDRIMNEKLIIAKFHWQSLPATKLGHKSYPVTLIADLSFTKKQNYDEKLTGKWTG